MKYITNAWLKKHNACPDSFEWLMLQDWWFDRMRVGELFGKLIEHTRFRDFTWLYGAIYKEYVTNKTNKDVSVNVRVIVRDNHGNIC